MIIVGIYPDQIFSERDILKNLYDEINTILPNTIVLHLLPFQVSCGDGGFAITDWYGVDNSFGTWDDIELIASNRKLIIDGVFNHIGIEHKFVKEFCYDPEKYEEYFFVNSTSNLYSPRGQKADQDILTQKGIMKVRKTHTDQTIDINLENPKIINEIETYLDFLKTKNIWGIRLDAVGYYKKGSFIRHNKGSIELANSIADLIKEKEFYVISQLDCDNNGLSYFSEPFYQDIALFDFSYSAFLCSTLITGDVYELSQHLSLMSKNNRVIIRAPRTHDGILLRSGNLTEECLKKICAFAKEKGIKMRETRGSIYELNCSLPFFLKLVYAKDVYKLIKMTIVFTGVLDSIAYYYYPYILGYIPELVEDINVPQRFELDDPRTLNRIPINRNFKINSLRKKEISELLKKISVLHEQLGDEIVVGKSIFSAYNNNVLKVSTANGKIISYFNFSPAEKEIEINNIKNFHILSSTCKNQNRLGAYEYIVYVHI